MSECTSCLGCKWLFTRDTGYSNWTVEDTDAHCAHNRNPKLPEEIPDEVRDYSHVWMRPENDAWHATKDGRCELYDSNSDYEAPYHIDCEGEEIVSLEVGRRLLTEEADPLPLLVAIYFNKGE